MHRLPFSLVLAFFGAAASQSADAPLLVTVSYHWYNDGAYPPAQGFDLTHIYSQMSVTADGELRDRNRIDGREPDCKHISSRNMRRLRSSLGQDAFMRAFSGAAKEVGGAGPAEQQSTVAIVIGARVATYPQSEIPAAIRPLLVALDGAHNEACHARFPSFVGSPLH